MMVIGPGRAGGERERQTERERLERQLWLHYGSAHQVHKYVCTCIHIHMYHISRCTHYDRAYAVHLRIHILASFPRLESAVNL